MRDKIISNMLLMVAVVIAGILFLSQESDLLWKAQELNLFLPTLLYAEQAVEQPAFLIGWLGSWCTQWLYYPWLGVVFLFGWWILLAVFMCHTLHVPKEWSFLLLIPMSALLANIVSVGYWIYFLKQQGFFFALTIGLTTVVLSIGLLRLLPRRVWIWAAYITMVVGLLMPFVGVYAVVAALAILVMIWCLTDFSVQAKMVLSVVVGTSVSIWFVIDERYVFCQSGIIDILTAGLPYFVLGDVDELTIERYAPYGVIMLSIVLLIMMEGFWKRTQLQHRMVRNSVALAVVVACGWGIGHYWMTDKNFHTELRMQRLLEKGDWQGMIDASVCNDAEPTRAIVMLRNLALFRLGRQGNEMYHYRNGHKPYATLIKNPMPRMLAHVLYYYYGEQNYCQRWCMENGVEMGFRVEYLKYLVRSSVVNNEKKLAEKYLQLLSKCYYYRDETKHYSILLCNRDKITDDAEMAPVFKLRRTSDMLGNDYGETELFLMHQFAFYQSSEALFCEQAVLSAMWTKEPALFWPCLMRYRDSHQGQLLPTHFQEAALLFANEADGVDISSLGISTEVAQRFERFMGMLREYDGISPGQMRQLAYPHFGNTYYYDCYLCS